MKNTVIRIAFVFLAITSLPFNVWSSTPPNRIFQMYELDKAPSFEAGSMSLGTFLALELEYPMEAREEAIEGKVLIEFIIAADGQIQAPTIVKGIGYGCDTEVLRVFEEMSSWKPGIKENRAVATRVVLPITFSLEE
ncbi:MAG: energy transducer TonB [Saprospiraceae bacterium]|nr:energy transducer TonB [Saprospiraceae bacterium]